MRTLQIHFSLSPLHEEEKMTFFLPKVELEEVLKTFRSKEM